MLSAARGGASVGLWFFGQLDRVRTLELERNRLLHVSTTLENLPRQTTPQQAQTIAELQKFIRDNYSQPNAYQALLRDIAEKTQTSWPDIAIRATLAILTLFLVQIFFAVYKYSAQLSNTLATKAEALDLLCVSAEDRRLLRHEMLSIVRDASPSFGAGPNTPLQDTLEFLKKLKDMKVD